MTEETTEFVALADERKDDLVVMAWDGLTVAAINTAVREASENTRKWLMEEVCGYCGEIPVLDEFDELVCYACGDPVDPRTCTTTRAEWLSRQEEWDEPLHRRA